MSLLSDLYKLKQKKHEENYRKLVRKEPKHNYSGCQTTFDASYTKVDFNHN